jgi:endonuclease YncB( thermonuclease family)
MYEYKCQLIRVIDGNTIEASIDLGFNVWTTQKIKLYGVDSTNPHSLNKDQIAQEKAALKDVLQREFVVRTIFNKRGKVGRVFGVVDIENKDGERININDYLIEKGAKKKN